jgi:NADH dehydrogenase
MAWAMWMFVHLMSLVGFSNRFIIFIQWTKNYFSSDRGVRIIIREFNLMEQKRKRKKDLEHEH